MKSIKKPTRKFVGFFVKIKYLARPYQDQIDN